MNKRLFAAALTGLLASAGALAALAQSNDDYSAQPQPLRPQMEVPRATGSTERRPLFSSNVIVPANGANWDYVDPRRGNQLQAMSNSLGQAQAAYTTADTEEEKRQAAGRIKESLGELFDADLENRRRELEEVRQRVELMARKLEQRLAKKEEIIELRFRVMVSEADGLGWSTGRPGFSDMQRSIQDRVRSGFGADPRFAPTHYAPTEASPGGP